MRFTNNRFAYTFLGVLALLLLVAFLRWTGEQDVKRAAWADAYEQCVREQYHTTPTAWYDQHGEYPDCQTQVEQ